MKIAIVIAHADDEVLGCGGTICKHIERGDEVIVLVVTKPNPEYSLEHQKQLRKAQENVDIFLGISFRYYLGYPCVSLNMIPYGEFNNQINFYIDTIEPDIIYTHFKGDLNRDHRIVYEACLVATRPPKKIKLACFETISETEWGDKAFKPNYYVDITDFLDKKNQAFSIYESEIKELPHPRNSLGIIALATQRGLESGFTDAEAFKIVRWYDK